MVRPKLKLPSKGASAGRTPLRLNAALCKGEDVWFHLGLILGGHGRVAGFLALLNLRAGGQKIG
jgi:hypothetical protein